MMILEGVRSMVREALKKKLNNKVCIAGVATQTGLSYCITVNTLSADFKGFTALQLQNKSP